MPDIDLRSVHFYLADAKEQLDIAYEQAAAALATLHPGTVLTHVDRTTGVPSHWALLEHNPETARPGARGAVLLDAASPAGGSRRSTMSLITDAATITLGWHDGFDPEPDAAASETAAEATHG